MAEWSRSRLLSCGTRTHVAIEGAVPCSAALRIWITYSASGSQAECPTLCRSFGGMSTVSVRQCFSAIVLLATFDHYKVQWLLVAEKQVLFRVQCIILRWLLQIAKLKLAVSVSNSGVSVSNPGLRILTTVGSTNFVCLFCAVPL